MKFINKKCLLLIILIAGFQDCKKILSSSNSKLKNHIKKHDDESKVDYRSSNYTGLDAEKNPLKMPKITPDKNMDCHTEKAELELVLKNHGLNEFAIRSLYKIIDLNNDGALSPFEWKNFKRIFFEPFQACDDDKDYYLTKDELKKCLEDASFNFIEKEKSDDIVKDLLLMLNTGKDKINFMGYMLMRRTALGWRECVAGQNMMSRSDFKCATTIASMGKMLSIGDTDAAFTVALTLGGVKPTSNSLTYPQFINICWFYNIFLEFDIPVAEGQISKKELKRGSDLGMLPSKMNANMINDIFFAIDPKNQPETGLTFTTFVILTMLHDKYTELSETALGLNFPKFCKFLSDSKLKFDITNWVDTAIIGIKDEDLEKASLSPDLIDDDVTEKDYIMFLQKNLIRKLPSKKDDCPEDKKDKNKKIEPNKANREILFNIVDQNDDGLISYSEYIVFIKYGFTFSSLDKDRNGQVDGNEIANSMVMNIAPIPMTKDEADKIFGFINYEIIERIDFLQYIAFCLVDYKMIPYLVKDTNFTVKKHDLERTLEKIDCKIIKKDLVASSKGVKLPHNDNYNYVSAFKVTLQTHARAKLAAFNKKNEKKDEKKEK